MKTMWNLNCWPNPELDKLPLEQKRYIRAQERRERGSTKFPDHNTAIIYSTPSGRSVFYDMYLSSF